MGLAERYIPVLNSEGAKTRSGCKFCLEYEIPAFNAIELQ